MIRRLIPILIVILLGTLSIAARALDGGFCALLQDDPIGEAVIAEIHDQKDSLSCMAHAATTALENLIYLKTGKRISISTRFLIANAARLKFEHNYKIDQGSKIAIPRYNKIQTVDQDLIFRAARIYGIVPLSEYDPEDFSTPKDRSLNLSFLLGAPYESLANGKFFSNLEYQKSFNIRLSEVTGPLPETFEYEGQAYTPITFAQAMLPDFKDVQYLIKGHEGLNRGIEALADKSQSTDVKTALEAAAKQMDKGHAVPMAMSWVKKYKEAGGVWRVTGLPQKFFLKEFYHGVVMVNYLRGSDGEIEWVKVANTHGLERHGKIHPNKGYYVLHRSYLDAYLLRLYVLDTDVNAQ